MPTKKLSDKKEAKEKTKVKSNSVKKTDAKSKTNKDSSPKKTSKIKTLKKEASKDISKKKVTVKSEKVKVTKKTAVKKKVTKKAPTKKASNKNIKDTESSAKTAAKIIANAKKNSKKVVEDSIEKQEVQEKKTDAQKNVIFVKKLSESRTKVVFKTGDFAVYPSHGVGEIVEIEKTTILGQDFHCYLMYFEKEKLTIKVPTISAEKIGLRHLATKSEMDEVFLTLRSGIKKLKGMWSRRAQEYETKINSGDIMLLAEVLRDLTRDIEDGERSYSERIIYETAVYRLAAEYAVIYGMEFEDAKDKVISTAKDKLGIEGKITQKDEFDEFDYDDEEDEEEDEEDEGEEDDELYGDESPKKRARG